MSRFTFRQLLNTEVLREEKLGSIFLLGFLLLRFDGELGTPENDQRIKGEILKMKPEELFTELEKDLEEHPEKFSGPESDRVKKIIAEVKAIIPVDEIREGKIR